MHIGLSQSMKMRQEMRLAPRMIQSMEILQLPMAALQEKIDQELAENVCLQQVDREREQNRNSPDNPDFLKTESHTAEEPQRGEVEQRELVANDDNGASDFERLVEISSDWPDDNYTSGSRPSGNQIQDSMDRAHDLMANALDRPQTLQEYLLEQFHYFTMSKVVSGFGEYLIQNLDGNGRLQSSLPEMMQVYGRSITPEQAHEALTLVQKLDPPGVGARDLSECLLLQLTPGMPFHDVLRTIISGHLDDLIHNRLPLIERKTGFTIDLINAAKEQMRSLNPFPGRGFASEQIQTITPDLRVEQNDKGEWVVEIIDEYVPSLRVSPRYLRMLESKPDAETREFIRKKVESARWLIESIEQRYNTLRRVAQTIVDMQREFLENGPEHIVPLKMQQIADVVNVHVTTVSRAVDDKHIATPRGIFPLKRFFGGGTTSADGEEVAWENIRRKLKEVVDQEDKSNPLSDDALVKAMQDEGITLARRTITKYRKAMGIPSSRQRREY
ncbi:MAG: RNA polymerase factor sigma-54 [Planctomycetaceae bacterium]